MIRELNAQVWFYKISSHNHDRIFWLYVVENDISYSLFEVFNPF